MVPVEAWMLQRSIVAMAALDPMALVMNAAATITMPTKKMRRNEAG